MRLELTGAGKQVTMWQGSSVVEQRTHKPLVVGSNPTPATSKNLHFVAKCFIILGSVLLINK